MANRVAIFIDGAYLDHVLRDEFENVRINYRLFSERLAGESDILRTYYYHCAAYQGNPPTAEESQRYGAQRAFFASLERLPRYNVKLGRLAVRYDRNGQRRFEQKQVDILLGVDLVQLAAKQNIQEAILVAGDSDFVPAIRAAKSEGVLVKLFHGPKPHNELWQESDERIRLDRNLINQVLRRGQPTLP